jgi:peroxiredoxin
MKKTLLFSLFVLGAASLSAFLAQKATVLPYNVGDTVSDFSLKNIDQKNVSFSNYPQAKGFIVVFTCNHCPFARAYEDRVEELNKKYMLQNFPVIAINPSDASVYEDDSFAKMQDRAKEKKYSFPYLLDENQSVAKAFGASRTPHVFILNKENGTLKVAYIGTIDDNSQDAAGVTKRYVEDAVNNLLAGKSISTPTTKAVGCAIKWKGV